MKKMILILSLLFAGTDLKQEKAREQTMILLLSVPTPITCCLKVGFTKEDRSLLYYEPHKNM